MNDAMTTWYCDGASVGAVTLLITTLGVAFYWESDAAYLGGGNALRAA